MLFAFNFILKPDNMVNPYNYPFVISSDFIVCTDMLMKGTLTLFVDSAMMNKRRLCFPADGTSKCCLTSFEFNKTCLKINTLFIIILV